MFDLAAWFRPRSSETSTAIGLPRWLERRYLEPALVVITLVTIVLSLLIEWADLPLSETPVLGFIAYAAGGFFGAQEGIKSLLKRELNIDFLMVLAALGAAVVGQWRDGAILLFLFSLSNVLQDYAIGRSRKAIRSLFAPYPEQARIRCGHRIETVPINEIMVGEIVLIQPGERIPVDGVVISGQSSVDQSTITGESMPIEKGLGDKVFAGTLNQQGALDVRAVQVASLSTLSRIIQMVEEAQIHKAPTQRFLDEFEQFYALGVIAASLLVMIIPWLAFGWSLDQSFYRAMVLLVVASPCALVISVPAAFLSAIAASARRGVIFKGGIHLEQMAAIKVVAFDKTGTLTVGRPVLTDCIPFGEHTENELLRVAGAVEARSEHPLSVAVRRAAETRGLPLVEVVSFSSVPGQGVDGILDGIDIRVGRFEYIVECAGQPPDELVAVHDRLQAEGKTVLLVCYGGDWMGALAVADQIRPQSSEVVDELHRVGIERVVMLTGDNVNVGQRIARQAHIDHVYADLLPEDKARIMEELERDYGPVAMIGDGVNDAPALAAATIGIAMGAAGTDVALETADVVLMGDELEAIPYAIRLSRRARRVVWQNISFALIVISLLILSTFMISLPLPLGVVGHEGSTVLVVLNGLRLLVARIT